MLEDVMFAWILQYWPYAVTIITTVMTVWAAIHAILWKRDIRSSLGWAGLILFSPGLGALLYFMFGINRVKRKAKAMRNPRERISQQSAFHTLAAEQLLQRFAPDGEALMQIAKAVQHVATRPLLSGNRIDTLVNGEEAFPALLAAIRGARHSISLVTYIFSCDSLGRIVVDELVKAHRRGVAVRVLIDAIGVRYHRPFVNRLLQSQGVPVAIFFPIRNISLFNLRTHRKICVVDGELGFTGGMNIRQQHLLEQPSSLPTADLHFRLAGPIVSQLQEVFAEDWLFTTGESLRGELWFRPLEPCGPVICRGIADGPDEPIHVLAWILEAAISSAKRRIRIVTPYFLPDLSLATALGVAASRGIEVDIIIPQRGNLPLVQWATMAQLWQVVSHDCRVWLSPPPFDHTKLVTVDGMWSLIGSSNWDQRSLGLNFEFNCEAYDLAFTTSLDALIDQRLARASRISLAQLQARPWLQRLRDSLARLVSPYL